MILYNAILNALNTLTVSVKKNICNTTGHSWEYEDYTHSTKVDGEPYEFKASRTCTRCRQQAWFYDGWQNSDKLNCDYESYYL